MIVEFPIKKYYGAYTAIIFSSLLRLTLIYDHQIAEKWNFSEIQMQEVTIFTIEFL